MRILSSILLAAVISQHAASAADAVPLEFINGIPFLNVSVGATSSRMMFDSGGRLGISVPAETITKSGSVQVLEEKKKFKDLQGNAYETPRVIAGKVVIGSTMLAPVQGQVHMQWGGAPEGPEAELTKARAGGAIGLEAFANFPLMFDYKQRTLSILDASGVIELRQPKWRALDLKYGNEGPVVTLQVEGKQLKFVLDTGAQVNVIRFGAACDTNQACELRDMSGALNLSMRIHRIKLDGAPFDGVLGAPFFRSHRVVFDVKGGKLYVSPV
ncbi:hypothetical protein [Duganella sp. Root198D2]|uniref:hypothetical protein n=1 Tax=Duganella sp. Root198D2 TaxID=1736489 RepID=UPI000A8BA403|nr:hypothetical protein [Duganella sp. Root198D2]